jgi:hypothetical protein
MKMHTTNTAGQIASTAKMSRTGRLVERITPAANGPESYEKSPVLLPLDGPGHVDHGPP